MLLDLNINFEVMVPDVKETWSDEAAVARTATDLAKKKARKCREKDSLIIAMDTIVAIRKKKLGKPKNPKEARTMLELLSGRTHEVVTGCALKWNDRIIAGADKTLVEFRKITAPEIDWYIESGEPFGKAGAYAIQGVGRIFISRIEGCYYNIVGFPLNLFQRLLQRWGLTILDLQRLSGNR